MPLPRTILNQISKTTGVTIAIAVMGLLGLAAPARAQRIDNQVAVFAALDKVTARISRLEIKLGENAKFGALKITPRVCYSRTPDLPPKTTTFVEVSETQLDGSDKKLFSGWMFAESPGLDAVEHPVYDVWLTECREPKALPGRPATASAAPAPKGAASGAPPPSGAATDDDGRRRRPPR